MAGEEEDYEAMPEGATILTHMVAGAAAGIMEHSIVYPVDCVKTRMQCLVPDPNANYKNVVDALYRIIRYEGMGNTMRGITAVVGGAGPAHALYFACYEQIKKRLSRQGQNNTIVHGVAGSVATLLHDAVMNPAEVLKQRMQMYNSPYSSCTQCGQALMRQEGMAAFYRSYTTQLSMNIPFQSIHFMVYEACQDWLNRDREYHPRSHVISGGMAGAVAAAVTTPMDVCKTLLNTQERCAISANESAITGMSQAFRTVYKFRGFSGFFKGMTARVIYQMPSTAISWSVYESFKYFIFKRHHGDGYITPSLPTVQVHAAARPNS